MSPAFLDELRHRTLLSGLIGRTTKLQKAGREFKACCPFHNEKSPSFYVNDEKGFYHCFGCGAHGDAIRWMTEARGLPFMDAVKELAGTAGLELPAPDPAARARSERATGLVGLTEAAATFYRKQLDSIEGAEARAYLDRRGIGAHARDAFCLGFAPDSRNRIKAAIEGAKVEDLIEAGLLIRPDDDTGREPYDRFRGRLMIPIRDARGRTIAFGGRILGAGEPKYLNSPETPLFDKGRTLYNLDRAGPIARKSGRAILVEGYLDVIALDQAGIIEAMAPLGTALTEAQMARLWSLVDAPILCFDGDNAGRKASLRAAERALAVLRPGKTLKFALLPPGKDPDDIVREGGAEAFEAAIADPVPLDVLLYQAERDAIDAARPEGRAGLRARLTELAESCTDRLVAEEYKRAFNGLFFEDFGWKKEERRTIASAILKTETQAQAIDLTRSFIRVLLWGFSRYPDMIGAHLEALSGLEIPDEQLGRWRDVLVSHVIGHGALDDDAIAAILATARLPEVLATRIDRDLLMPWTRPGVDRRQAMEQLAGTLEIMAAEREHQVQQDMLNAEALVATSEGDEERFVSIEAERGQLREEQAALIEMALRLGEPVEESRQG